MHPNSDSLAAVSRCCCLSCVLVRSRIVPPISHRTCIPNLTLTELVAAASTHHRTFEQATVVSNRTICAQQAAAAAAAAASVAPRIHEGLKRMTMGALDAKSHGVEPQLPEEKLRKVGCENGEYAAERNSR